MKCPVCKDTNLVMTERQAIEIDYCPDCRGVWLDRGELDKIIERTRPEAPQQLQGSGEIPREARDQRRDEPRRDDHRRDDERRYEGRRHDDDDRRYHDSKHYDHKHHKRKSLLGELFDF